MINTIIDFILHIDVHLTQLTLDYGVWVYIILFLIVFCETGLVVMPFLPGDSLLFAAGALSAIGGMNIYLVFVIFLLAAFLGDTVNYWIGKYIGPKAFSMNTWFFKKEYLEKAKAFFDKHGVKSIVLARFVPIVRTFAPFIAGIGDMEYKTFITYNFIGGLAWVVLFVFAGYFFGNVPFVKHNFEIVIFAIIGISAIPIVYEIFMESKWGKGISTKFKAQSKKS
jgi:membrane-associated protein